MAPSHPITGVRIVHTSKAKYLSQTSIMSSWVRNGSTGGLIAPLPQPYLPSTSRRFWWGRNGYTNKPSSYHANYHKCLEAHQRIIKYRSGKGVEQPAQKSKEHFLDFQYRPSQGWRLLSSWNKPNGRWEEPIQSPKDKDNVEAERQRQWNAEYQKRQEEIASRFEALKRKIAEDPYAMLFGRRLQRGVWNPWTPFESEVPPKPKGQWPTNETKPATDKTAKATDKEKIITNPVPPTKKPTSDYAPLSRETPSSAAQEIGSRVYADTEEYDIDPISMRKVPRKLPDLVSTLETTVAAISKETPQERSPQPTERGNIKLHSKHSKSSDSPTVDRETKPSAPPLSGFAKFWLAREGFSTPDKQFDSISSTPVTERKKSPVDLKGSCKKIESSLDRHLQRTTVGKPTVLTKHAPLEYKMDERKEEDIDLLRASDVRAASGAAKLPNKESEEEKLARRKKLEDSFVARSRVSDSQYDREIAIHRAKSLPSHKPLGNNATEHKASAVPEASYTDKNVNPKSPATDVVNSRPKNATSQVLDTVDQTQLENKIQNEENNSYAHEIRLLQTMSGHTDIQNLRKDLEKQVLRLEEQHAKELHLFRQEQDKLVQQEIREIQRREEEKRKASEAALAKEISLQKAAMEAAENGRYDRSPVKFNAPSIQLGEGDMSANVHEFVNRDRWYKKKAPHAVEQELQLQNKRKEQQARDKALIREMRGIYEDTYGVIDSKHRQPTSPNIENAEYKAVQGGLQTSGELQNRTSDKPTELQKSHKPNMNATEEGIQKGVARDSSHLNTETLEHFEPPHKRRSAETRECTPAISQTADQASAEDDKVDRDSSKLAGTEQVSREAEPSLHSKERLEIDESVWMQKRLEHRLQNQQKLKMLLDWCEHNENLLQNTQKRIKKLEENFERLSKAVKLNYTTKFPSQDGISGLRNPISFTRDTPKNSLLSPSTQSPSLNLGPSVGARNTYKILALDHTSHEVICANTTSSLFEASFTPRSASNILSHLANPAKFITHLENLEGTGFELVAGTRNMLVYKLINETSEGEQETRRTKSQFETKYSDPISESDNLKIPATNIKSNASPTRQIATNVTFARPDHEAEACKKATFTAMETSEAEESAENLPDTDHERGSDSFKRKHPVNPIDGTTSRFASPTGFVNHDAVFPLQSPGEKVRREEDVFSGSSRNRWSEEESVKDGAERAGKGKRGYMGDLKESQRSGRVFRELKRLFWTASFFAAFCYALGILAEWRARAREVERRSKN